MDEGKWATDIADSLTFLFPLSKKIFENSNIKLIELLHNIKYKIFVYIALTLVTFS